MNAVYYKGKQYGTVIGGVWEHIQDDLTIPVDVLSKLSDKGVEKVNLIVGRVENIFTLKEVVRYGATKEPGIVTISLDAYGRDKRND